MIAACRRWRGKLSLSGSAPTATLENHDDTADRIRDHATLSCFGKIPTVALVEPKAASRCITRSERCASGDEPAIGQARSLKMQSDQPNTTICGQDGCGESRACCRADCPIIMVDARYGCWRWIERPTAPLPPEPLRVLGTSKPKMLGRLW